jgi:DNA-binding NarL/FixJ family response regulator
METKITLDDFIRKVLDGKREGKSDEELAISLQISVQRLKEFEELIKTELHKLLQKERFPLEYSAEVLGVNPTELKEYAYFYQLPISPYASKSKRKLRPLTLQKQEEKKKLHVKEKKPEEASSPEALEKKSNIFDLKRRIDQAIEKLGYCTAPEITKETGIKHHKVYDHTKGNTKVCRRKSDRDLFKIREAMKGRTDYYVDDIIAMTGLSKSIVSSLRLKHDLPIKVKKQYSDYSTNERTRHRMNPKTILKDKLIRRGLSISQIADKLGEFNQSVNAYIHNTNQYETWRQSREHYLRAHGIFSSEEKAERNDLVSKIISAVQYKKLDELPDKDKLHYRLAFNYLEAAKARHLKKYGLKELAQFFKRYCDAEKKGKKITMTQLGGEMCKFYTQVTSILDAVGLKPIWNESKSYITEEKKQELLRLYNSGLSVSETAEISNINDHTVEYHLRKMLKNHLRERRLVITEEKKQELLGLYKLGLSVSELSEIADVKYLSARYHLKNLLKRNPRRNNPMKIIGEIKLEYYI